MIAIIVWFAGTCLAGVVSRTRTGLVTRSGQC